MDGVIHLAAPLAGKAASAEEAISVQEHFIADLIVVLTHAPFVGSRGRQPQHSTPGRKSWYQEVFLYQQPRYLFDRLLDG